MLIYKLNHNFAFDKRWLKNFKSKIEIKAQIMKKTNDSFGDRMKMYESQTTQRKLIPRIPVVARLDGHTFSKWTKGLKRPYDKRLSDLMIETTRYMVEKYNANCGYTQSDEITLTWYIEDFKSEMIFKGKGNTVAIVFLFTLYSDEMTPSFQFSNNIKPGLIVTGAKQTLE